MAIFIPFPSFDENEKLFHILLLETLSQIYVSMEKGDFFN